MADAVEGDRAYLLGRHAEHLSRVLRARVGQEFDVATPDGVRRAKVASVSDERVEFELGASIESGATTDLTLLLAIFKFDRMESAIEKCTELGVTQIVPVVARRTEPHLASAAEKRVERWRRIAIQAAEQSRRQSPAEITTPVKLKNALDREGVRIALAESEEQIMLADVVDAHPTEPATLAVGPEGGWTDDELKLFAKKGWLSASLGETILRAETAAIAATAIVMALRR
jgi:16S rRNA (uracil1498-N3)-methyltransferase